MGHANPRHLRPSPLRAPRWHKTLVVAVLLAAAACADVADTPSTPRSTQPPPTPTGTGVTVPAFDRGRFAAVIPLPGAGCVTVADGVLWVLDASGTVARIDPETNRVAGRSVRIGASPQSLAVGGGSLWVANHEAGTVTRIEQASGKTVADIPVPSEPHRVAYGAGAVWVGNWHGISVSRIDPETNRVVGSPIPIGFRAGNLVVGTGGVWVTSDDRVDAAPRGRGGCAHRPADQPSGRDDRVGGHPIDVAATEGAVWVSVADPGTVLRIAGR